MPRLIDATPIEKTGGWLDGTALVIPKQLIYDAPTVDAIPISYIRDWIERHPTDCNTVEGMLMDWREIAFNASKYTVEQAEEIAKTEV